MSTQERSMDRRKFLTMAAAAAGAVALAPTEATSEGMTTNYEYKWAFDTQSNWPLPGQGEKLENGNVKVRVEVPEGQTMVLHNGAVKFTDAYNREKDIRRQDGQGEKGGALGQVITVLRGGFNGDIEVDGAREEDGKLVGGGFAGVIVNPQNTDQLDFTHQHKFLASRFVEALNYNPELQMVEVVDLMTLPTGATSAKVENYDVPHMEEAISQAAHLEVSYKTFLPMVSNQG